MAGSHSVLSSPSRLLNLPSNENFPFTRCRGFTSAAAGGHGGLLVSTYDHFSVAVFAELSGVNPDYALAEAANLIHLMADKNNRPAALRYVLHFAQALFLEFDIANGEHLVHQQNFRLQVRGHRKRQTHLHSRAVVLERRIEKALDLREGHDGVFLPLDFAFAHAKDRAAEVDVLAARQFG